HTKRV
ncbi:efflux transporter, RND family, MFP subunit, partial [Vibrio parahaemolyticus V-223/04]